MTTPPRDSDLVLGVDGGGTSTVAWLAQRDGPVIGRGRAGPSNAKAVGLDASRAALDAAIEAAFVDAQLPRAPVEVACLGVAGFDRPADRATLESWSNENAWARRLHLGNDGDLVVAAGTPEGWGVGVISGTGSIAVGMSPEGRKARSGGWGYLMGDEGSAYDVALRSLRYIARHHDGRAAPNEATRHLTERFCQALGVEEPAQIVSAVYVPGFDRTRIAALAPLTLESAAAHPSLATDLLEPAGQSLAELIEAVATTLDLPRDGLPLAIAGGFLLAAQPVRGAMLNTLARAGFVVQPTPVTDPVAGAVSLARRHAQPG